jgi:hypothetical protein
MDTSEHLDEVLDSMVGSTMCIDLKSVMDTDGTWKTIGKGTFGGSLDGKVWKEITYDAMSIDKDLGSAVATVMFAISKYTSSEDFNIDLVGALESKETDGKLTEG